jgi:hypothetical protein
MKNKLQERMQELEQLGAPRELSNEEKFKAALVGFLPLIAGVGSVEDIASGAKVGQEAVKQMSEEKRLEDQNRRNLALQALQSVGKEESRDLREEEVSLRKEGRELQKQRLSLEAGREERLSKGQTFKEQEQEVRKETAVIDKFEKANQKSKEALNYATKVEELVKTNSPLSGAFVIRALARISGEVGVLTDQDVNAFKGSRAWTDRMQQAFEEATTGKLTESNKKYILEAVKQLKNIETGVVNTRAEDFAKKYGRVLSGGEQRAKELIDVKELQKRQITKEEALAELARRRALKAK